MSYRAKANFFCELGHFVRGELLPLKASEALLKRLCGEGLIEACEEPIVTISEPVAEEAKEEKAPSEKPRKKSRGH